MADDVNIKIKLGADLSGGMQSRQELEKLRQQAKRTNSEINSSAGQAAGGVKGLSASVGLLRKAMAGFGALGLFTGLVAAVSKIRDSFGRAKKEAEEFRKIQEQLASDKSLASMVQGYERIRDAVAAANVEQRHSMEMIDADVSNRRRLDRAKLNADKEAEIAALDAGDPAYAEKKAQIEARYASRSAEMSASDAKEDVVLARQKLEKEAEAKEGEAAAQDAGSDVLREKIHRAQESRSKALEESRSLNDRDNQGFWSNFAGNVKSIVTLDWGRVGDSETAEGDQVRRDAAQRAAAEELNIQQLEEELRKSEEKSAALRGEAGRLRERREKMGGALEAVELEGDTARKGAYRAEEASGAAVAAKEREEEEKAARTASAMTAAEQLEREKAALEQRIAEERAKKAAAGRAVFDAQGALDIARANGGGTAAAAGALHAAQESALEVNHAADGAIEAMTAALKNVTARLEAAQRQIESQGSQTRYAWSEQPAGR